MLTKLAILYVCSALSNSLIGAPAKPTATALVPAPAVKPMQAPQTAPPVAAAVAPVSTTIATPPPSVNFPPASQVNFNVNFAQNTHNVTKSSSNAQTEAASYAKQETPLLSGLQDLWAQMPNAKKIGFDLQSQTQNFLTTYKWRLIGMSAAAAYAFLCYYLYMGNFYLSNMQLWSSWRQEIPLEQILAIPQQQHAQELIHEIRLRYTTADNLSNAIQPLALFMNAVTQEEELLLWYQKVFSWLAYIRLTKITPMSTSKFEKISERLARLAYYKNLFQSWVTTYQSEPSNKHHYA